MLKYWPPAAGSTQTITFLTPLLGLTRQVGSVVSSGLPASQVGISFLVSVLVMSIFFGSGGVPPNLTWPLSVAIPLDSPAFGPLLPWGSSTVWPAGFLSSVLRHIQRMEA